MKLNWPFERSVPLLFLLVTIVAYGLLLPFTGFYWDDWPFAWMAKFLGPQEFTPAFAGVRPFLGPIFFVTTSLIPPVPLYWQIFALLIRLLAVLSAWFALTHIWPRHKQQTLIASLLFLVFPGYSQHWVAFTHINQEWIPYIFYLLSFGFTARALRGSLAQSGGTMSFRPAVEAHPINQLLATKKDTILALLLLAAGVFPTEYFVSIEPMRFLFIWVIISEQMQGIGHRFVETLKHWWPYLLIWLGNGAWLAYFYTVGGYASYEVEVANEPITIAHLFSTIGETIWKAGFYIWAQILVLASRALTAPTTLVTLALIIGSFVLLFFYLNKWKLSEGEAGDFTIPAILIGLAGIVLGRIPSFAAGLPLTLQSSFDRFMISMMLGASLFIVGMVELLIRNNRIKLYLFALLIALGIGGQFFNANIFRRDWAKQQEIYWQLAWRIPALKPGTALLTHQLPVDYETDLSFTAPINWMYAPAYKRSDLPYALLYTEKRLGGASLPSLEKDTKISLPIRRVSFQGSTSQALVIYMPQNGCLRVLDPGRGDQITYGHESRFLVDAIPLSDLSNIIVEADQTAQISFLSEPQHTWCYYFAKAELAHQGGDWNQVIDLIDKAKSLGYKPEDPWEWLTYIEAQALAGSMDAARELSMDVFRQEKRTRKGLCELWKRVEAAATVKDLEVTNVNEILSNLGCTRSEGPPN
ncbi:MAG TPA: hypothetical protein VFY83_17400 [Anaerolineales bacterium]|nr:hypothetical protein [Anaerolineales bacterium]